MDNTQCTAQHLLFQDLGSRVVVADFDGGTITSDAGAMFLREIDGAIGFFDQLAECFGDYRNQQYVEHTVRELLAQRIIGICLGYEDLNDHELLRADPLFATICGKIDPSGANRRLPRDKGIPLAGKSTLNRMELHPRSVLEVERYHRIAVDEEQINEFFVRRFLDSHRRAPERIVLDLDATDDPLHGEQEGRFYHGYYDCYCYLPLYIFCGTHPLRAKLRRSNIDASHGSREEIETIVAQIRRRWPKVRIVLRGDSGFCRDELMSWCEANEVGYIFGLAKNARLLEHLRSPMNRAICRYLKTGKPARVFTHFRYRTIDSWSKKRHIIGKAEYLGDGENPRFVVFHLPGERFTIREIYEQEYCARGDMENRIKEQQLYLFADRTSSSMMRANQLRLWFSTAAYMLMNELRHRALAGTEFQRAGCETIRLKLMKIGARVRVSVRRIHVSISTAYPYRELLFIMKHNLQQAYQSHT